MTALTIRLRNAADRDAVERLKDATGEGTASRAILRAVREWPGLVEELAAEREKVEDLRTALLDIVEAEASLPGAQAHRTSALEAAATVTDRNKQWPCQEPRAIFLDQADDPPVADAVLKEREQPVPRDRVEVRPQFRVDNPTDLTPFNPDGQSVECIMRPAPRTEPVAETKKLHLVDRCQDHVHNRLLDDLVLQRCDPERSCSAVGLGYLYPPHRRRPVRSPAMQASVQVEQPPFQPFTVHLPRDAVDACRSVSLQREVRPV